MGLKLESVGVIISKQNLIKIEDTSRFLLTGQSVASRFKNCFPDGQKRFSASLCSGFLVAKDLFVTAGHCVSDRKSFCQNFKILFDYQKKGFHFHKLEGSEGTYYSEKLASEGKELFSCKKVILKRYRANHYDIALLRLTRAVPNRSPLALIPRGHHPKTLRTIGSQLGSPLTVSSPISFKKHRPFDTATSFTIAQKNSRGSSGGPAINEKGQVAGLIISSIQRALFNEKTQKCQSLSSDIPFFTTLMKPEAIRRVISRH